MLFQILSVVLWSRHGHPPQKVNFRQGCVNVISGDSKTGKSAVIPIIDYCLGAQKCAIPVGEIRDHCAWFGVVVQTDEGQKLFARREPGDQKETGDMFVLEGPEVTIPDSVVRKNTTADAVREQLNRLAALPNLDLEPGNDRGFRAKPSFRDFAAFNFQPQNIIANPSVLFFKADTTEHREKLKAIFPYALGAIDAKKLAAKQRLESIRGEIRRKELALARLKRASDQWISEGQGWLLKASELGLSLRREPPSDPEGLLAALREVLEANPRDLPTPKQTNDVLGRLGSLRDDERTASQAVYGHRQRLADIARLEQSGNAYGKSLRIQRDRLAIAEWLQQRFASGSDDAQLLATHNADRLSSLCEALQTSEAKGASYSLFSEGLHRERLDQQQALATATERLRATRGMISALEQESDEAKTDSLSLREVDRFLGRLEQALLLYTQSDDASPLVEEIENLRTEEASLRHEVSERTVKERVDSALNRLQALTSLIIPNLDAEWKDAPIRLDIDELTVVVDRGQQRRDYLWEVGSGANWLAYHVAMTLGLQQYFLKFKRHPAPALLVYDQPSQVYFPKQEDFLSGSEKRNSDIQAVRSVFRVLGEATVQADGRLQIIVLDHAFEDVWGDLPGVQMAQEWRDSNKLVPQHWISSEGTKPGAN